jgi:histidinol-phosphate aminotransferase
VIQAIQRAADDSLRLYPDPECLALRQTIAQREGLKPEQVFCSNGSDEALAFAFQAFFDPDQDVVFPRITYSFYPVYTSYFGLKCRQVAMNPDFSDPIDLLCGHNGGVVLCNPNAPTGIAVGLDTVERLLQANPEAVVVVDEAYVDFGAQSAAGLIQKYDNLLVVMTYSKSRSMAGARLGFALAGKAIIQDLEKVKYSTNPYNVNRLTLKLGQAAVDSDDYFRANAQKIQDTRAKTTQALRALGFQIPDSQANFIFAKREGLDGGDLYRKLKDRGILIRHFSDPRIAQYNRITIGTAEDMDAFVAAVADILKEEGLA